MASPSSWLVTRSVILAAALVTVQGEFAGRFAGGSIVIDDPPNCADAGKVCALPQLTVTLFAAMLTGSEKLIVMFAFVRTPVAPAAGLVEVTVGGT